MLKEAIEKISQLAQASLKPTTLEAGGKLYATGELKELRQPETLPGSLLLHTLSGLVDYVKSEFDEPEHSMALHIADEVNVVLRSQLFGEYKLREDLALCKPFSNEGFRFGHFYEIESFVIALQSRFVQDETTAAILKIVGNVQARAVQTVVDDGISQQVTAKAGVAGVKNVVLPNPVTLRPFRTFQEIEQPESRFVLRLRQGDEGELPRAALFEFDDCQWKLTAANSIRDYLREHLPDVRVFA